jgi:hypothetical protein
MIQPILRIGAQARKCWWPFKYGKLTFSILYDQIINVPLSIYTFTVYIGSAIYAPSVPGVMEDFNCSEIVASLGLALYVLTCTKHLSPFLEIC